MRSHTIEPIKDLEQSHPIPTAWRGVISNIVIALVDSDYGLDRGIPNVEPVDTGTAAQIENYILDYGETLTPLTEEAWERSCAQWVGDHWDVIVDLCTESEGVSDMVLSGKMRELETGLSFEVHMVYVP